MKLGWKLAAVAGIGTLALAGCGSAPEDEPGASTGSTAEAIDYTACMVSDSGGFEDRSFNQSGYEGLQQAETDLGVQTQTAESTAADQFGPNVDTLVQQNCNMIIGVGFLLADAIGEAADANPETDFALIDSTVDPERDNVQPIIFNTAEASYLAGYLAAGQSTTGVVATYGGVPIPSVTVFMDGFADGVAAYNEAKGADVQLLGWDKDAQTGAFVGNFEDQAAGQTLTQGFLDSQADVIMPVAGPVGLGTVAAVRDAVDGGAAASIVWVDSDGYETNPDDGDLFLTTVVKEIGTAVEDVVSGGVDDEFSSAPYIGTLENGGVGLAPYHDFDAQISDELKGEVEDLKQQIIDGTLMVESENSPS